MPAPGKVIDRRRLPFFVLGLPLAGRVKALLGVGGLVAGGEVGGGEAGVVCTVNDREAGVGSLFPAASTARNATVWLPAASPGNVCGEAQSTNAAPSKTALQFGGVASCTSKAERHARTRDYGSLTRTCGNRGIRRRAVHWPGPNHRPPQLPTVGADGKPYAFDTAGFVYDLGEDRYFDYFNYFDGKWQRPAEF